VTNLGNGQDSYSVNHVAHNSADTLADGLAVRVPHPQALEYMLNNIDRIITVSEEDILAAIHYYFNDTHNIAEGAGANPLAALLKEKDSLQDKKVGVILSGGNIEQSLFERALTH